MNMEEAKRKRRETALIKTEKVFPIVKEKVQEGMSLSQVAEHLNNLGYSREDVPFKSPIVQNILKLRGVTVTELRKEVFQKFKKENNEKRKDKK